MYSELTGGEFRWKFFPQLDVSMGRDLKESVTFSFLLLHSFLPRGEGVNCLSGNMETGIGHVAECLLFFLLSKPRTHSALLFHGVSGMSAVAVLSVTQ